MGSYDVRSYRNDFEADLNEKLQQHLDDLGKLYQRRKTFLDEYFVSEADIVQRNKQRKVEAAEKLFDKFQGMDQKHDDDGD